VKRTRRANPPAKAPPRKVRSQPKKRRPSTASAKNPEGRGRLGPDGPHNLPFP
jgi:hypothetical protein